ncbi:MAG: leucine-rich repeat domain-containing protein, partial [Clostridiales bacterium]|nr:leucine-rich repeat domain-containing protein [Clostridiales bacterium]
CMFIEEIVLPESLLAIKERAFRGMKNLRSLRIPDKVRSGQSDRDILSGCSALKSIKIGAGFDAVPDGFACDCNSLEHISFPDSLRSIGKSAFQSCTSLKEAVLPESVVSIGENAFRACRELRTIWIGSEVTDIGNCSFVGISSDADIICVSDSSAFDSFSANIHSMRDAAGICAPHADLDRAEPYLKALLACGYIMHPESRYLYSFDMNEAYRKYIREVLPGYALELSSKGMIFRILTESVYQGLISDPVTIDMLAAHARSGVVSDREKAILDNITRGTSQENKSILRKLRAAGHGEEWSHLVSCYGDIDAVTVRSSRSDEAAPQDLVTYVLYTYMDMFRKSTGAGSLAISWEADEMAEYLNKDDLVRLCLAWCGSDPGEKLMDIPGLLFPLLRYADNDILRQCAGWAEYWSDHDKTGSRGYETLHCFTEAILLSDTAAAAGIAYENSMLADYARVRGKEIRELFREWLGSDRSERDKTSYAEIAYSYYTRQLRNELLSITTRSCTEFFQYFDNDYVIREIRDGLVFVYRDGSTEGRFMMEAGIPRDDNGNKLDLSDNARIWLAHVIDMGREETLRWKKLIKSRGENAIEQMDVRIPSAMRGDARRISSRYAGLEADMVSLHSRNNGLLVISGTNAMAKLSFRGKTVLELKAAKPGDIPDTDIGNRKYTTGSMIVSGFNNREICSMITALDIMFFPQLIRKGAADASEYPELTDPDNIDELLRSSIESGNNENIAYFLGRKQELTEGNGDTLDPDADLDW